MISLVDEKTIVNILILSKTFTGKNQVQMQKNYSVCLLGTSLETNNMGVSALTASLINLILEAKSNAKIYLMIGSRSPQPQKVKIKGKTIFIEVINFRLSPRSPLSQHLFWILFLGVLQRFLPFKNFKKKIISKNLWLKTLNDANFIGDIRGGDSFSDIYGLKRFLLGSIPALIVLLLNKDFVLLPQTYGPYNSYFVRKISKYILEKSKQIYSRDKFGVETVSNIVKKNAEQSNIQFCPDVAFTLEAVIPKIIYIVPPLNKKKEKVIIGINVNGLMYCGGYTRDNMFGLKFDYRMFINDLLINLLERIRADILLIPHVFAPKGNVNSDSDACHELFQMYYSKYKNRLHIITKEYNQYKIKGIIGFSDFFIGSRMHACIAAISQGIPTVGLAYSSKFIGVFNSIGFGNNVVDARKVDANTAINQIIDLYMKRNEQSFEIKQKIPLIKNKIKDVFNELFSLELHIL